MKASRWIPVVVATASSRSSVLSFVSKRGISRRHAVSASRIMMASTSSSPPLIDVDCNLWHKDLKKSLQNKQEALSILDEDAITKSNIVAMMSPSSTLDEARHGLNVLCEGPTRNIAILTTVGVHPYHVNDEGTCLETDVASIKKLVVDNQEHVCAVGECGLDASEGFPPLQDQLPWFQAQVKVAMECNKPLFVHERLAFQETMEILQDCTVPVIVHCFTGTREECKMYIKRGYSLSISGFIFKDDADETRACLREGLIPLDRLMIETDAPYMGFEGCRANYLEKNQEYVESLNSKKRKRLVNNIYPNVPSSLPLVLEQVVNLLNEGRSERGEALLELDEVARITTENAIRFFGFKGVDM